MAKFEGNDIRELFSKNLKQLRHLNHLSQLALSAKAGLAHNFVNDIENGKKWVSPNTIAKLATALDTDPGVFFTANPLGGKETKKISGYLDEINEQFNKAVEDIKTSYLKQGGDDDNDE
jgi:transcriptional regulator with XRE-family HTH domain